MTSADNSNTERNDKIQSIYRAAPAGIGMVVDRVITEANEKLCLLTGYSMEELIGNSARLLYENDEDFEYVGREKYRKIHEQGTGSVETRWKKKNGEIIDIILSSSALDINDLSKGVVFTALDITDRKRYEELNRNNKLQIENITANIPVVLFQFYSGGNGEIEIKYLSGNSEKVLGINCGADDFFNELKKHLSERYEEKFLRSMECSIKKKITWEYEGVINKGSDESAWIRIIANPVSFNSGLLFNGFAVDITDSVKYLSLAEREYKHNDLALLTRTLANDFNNIISGIFGYLEIAMNHSGEEDIVKEQLEKALDVFYRAKELTSRLRDFSNLSEPLKKNNSITLAIIETTRNRLSGSGYTYNLNLADDLLICEFDYEQISYAIGNIITNAIQAMPEGGDLSVSAENIVISEERKTFLTPGNYVLITIRDSGAGIPGEVLSRIFNPFFTTKKKFTGMGLATSYAIIKNHRGTIEVYSTPGKGAAFHIYLPAVEKAFPVTPSVNTFIHGGKGGILIIDDEITIRETVG
ncbi:MAG TPA: ATP-binding protein, partial [Spirochaetota bacterium]|nr:ATP-binding protein [Spirochaetota bacterium]